MKRLKAASRVQETAVHREPHASWDVKSWGPGAKPPRQHTGTPYFLHLPQKCDQKRQLRKLQIQNFLMLDLYRQSKSQVLKASDKNTPFGSSQFYRL